MSRIDDDIDDRRAAEYLLQQQTQADLVNKKKKLDGSEFDRRMADGLSQRAMQTQVDTKKGQANLEAARDPRGAEVLREAKDKARAGDTESAHQLEGNQQTARQALQGKQGQGKQQEGVQRRSQDASLLLTRQLGSEQAEGQRGERRLDSSQSGRAMQDDKQASAERKKETTQDSSAPKAEGSDERVERQEGREGGKKDGGGGDSKGGGEPPPNFRLNPALLAPPPLARPKDDARTEKLRKLANEIAQRIVERARVGRNAAGQAEFQLDLRSNVLSGLQIKVSASGGRISALFSGSDRKVLAMLRENADTLKQSLQSRGLTLAELKIEATA